MSDLRISASSEELMLAALERGEDASATGRFVVTFKEGAVPAGIKSLKAKKSLRLLDARDFSDQALNLEKAADADGALLPEIGVAVIGGAAAAARNLSAQTVLAADSPIASIDPEYFMYAAQVTPAEYARIVRRVAQGIYDDLNSGLVSTPSLFPMEGVEEVKEEVLGTTWGLGACKVPVSAFSGAGIRVATLDTGFDLGHPEFSGRTFVTQTFVGQPVQDLSGHGTHITGTACGPQIPPGLIQRYGIGYRTVIFVGKVLTNSDAGTQAQLLAGMNWAVASGCTSILLAVGAQISPQPSFTAAGQAALNHGCLMIAAAGAGSNRPATIAPAGAPANSPTIMSVGALDRNLKIAPFSPGGKIDIAGPGVGVFSSFKRPQLHSTANGSSSAAAHVAGCAALWAQTSPALRGPALMAKLKAAAKPLPFPPSDVGAGLVQAP